MKKIYLLFVMCFIGALTGVAQNVIRIIDGDSEKVYLASDLDSLTIRAIDYYSAEAPLPPSGDVEDDVNAEYVNRVLSNTGLTLMATQHFVEPGEAIKFAVLDENGNDVTAEAKVYVIENKVHKPLSNKTYVCQEVGTYQFWAFYNDLETRHDALLEVISVTDKLDVLADANPTSTDFFHRALIIKATGVNCPNGPRATDGIHMFFDNSDYAENAVQMALHTYDDGHVLSSKAAITLTSQAGLGGSYPAIKLNFDKLIPTLGSPEIAKMLNVGVRTAETAFKDCFGLTIHQYQLMQKIEHAKFYLEYYPNMKIIDISLSLGFYDEFHFSRQFKKFLGISPTDYKKTHLKENKISV
jgi:AraC-like DNA-binding protein